MEPSTAASDRSRDRSPAFPASRLTVSGLFFLNGFVVGSWAPKIPEFAARLGLSDAELGLMILAFGIGALVVMLPTGAWIAHAGSRAVVRTTTVLLVPALGLATLAPGIPFAVPAVVFFGAACASMDIAMNANAVVVERQMGRAIMSSCHGFWSLGGLAGAAGGGLLIAGLGVGGHALAITLFGAVIAALLLPRAAGDGGNEEAPQRPPIRLPRTPLPYLIGMMALFSMVPEGAVLDWSALYLRQELAAGLSLSGLGFGAFSAMMAVMRFAGDPVRDRLGAVRTLRLFTGFALVGMVIAGLAPNAAVAIAGFAVAGIGISNMVPIAFSAAGNLPGMAPGIGLSVVTSMGYSGVLFAPTIIGFVAEYVEFGPIFTALPVLFLAVFRFSGLARYADSPGRAAQAA